MTADEQRGGPDGGAARNLPQRFARLAAWARRLRTQLTEQHPRVTEAVRFTLAPATIDRCFAVAAQIFMTAIPMALAVSAFLPQSVRDRVRRGLGDQLGIRGPAAQAVTAFFDGGASLREAVGVVGLLLALISATSLTRRLQRLYETQWSLPPGRMRASALRWFAWILVWVTVLAVQGPLRSGRGAWLTIGWILSAAMSVALWWWTPHLLLLRRVGWRRLLPTALLTGIAQAAVGAGSRVVMPGVTGRSVAEYGPFGLVLSLMSWLLVVAGVIVVGAGLGRIAAEDVPGPEQPDRPGTIPDGGAQRAETSRTD